jgi:hypothetical protein
VVYTVSDLLKQYLAQPSREFELKAVISGPRQTLLEEFGDFSSSVTKVYTSLSVLDIDVEDSVVPSEDLTLGTVIASKLTISIRTADPVAKNAKIEPLFRMRGAGGNSEWMGLGTYYVDSRSYQNGVWKFTCYDKLIWAQQLYVSSLSFPISMQEVFDEIRVQLNFAVDPSVVINPAYMIPYKPENFTVREMLGYIASAHSSSVKIMKDGNLGFVKFSAVSVPTSVLPSDYYRLTQTNPKKTFTKVLLTYNEDGETLYSGSGDDDRTLRFYNPFVDQAMLDDIFANVNGLSYVPMTMDWKGRPDLEVGDSVEITLKDGTTIPSLLLTNKFAFKGGLVQTSTAPSHSPQQSEFDYRGNMTRSINQAIKSKAILPDEPYYGVTIGRANGLKIERSDGVTQSIWNSDKMEITKNGVQGFYVDAEGKIVLNGAVVSGDGAGLDISANQSVTAQAQEIALKASQTQVDTLNGTVSTHSTQIQANSDKIDFEVTRIDGDVDGLQSDMTTVKTYMEFDTNGLTLGKSDSPLQITISNAEMDFLDSGKVVAYINGQKMYIDSLEVLSNLVVGVHKVEKYDGNTTLVRWVG